MSIMAEYIKCDSILCEFVKVSKCCPSPLAHVSVADVSAGPDELGPRVLHFVPDQLPLLLRLEADQVHAAPLTPVPGP